MVQSMTCLPDVQVLWGPQKLPTPQAAAYKSMPEAQMVGRRIALAEAGFPVHGLATCSTLVCHT